MTVARAHSLGATGLSICAALLMFGGVTTAASAAALTASAHGLSAAQSGLAIKIHDYRDNDDYDHEDDEYRDHHRRHHEAQHHRHHHDDAYDDDDDVVVDAPYAYVEHRGHVVVEAPYTSVYVGHHGSHIQAPFVDLWLPRY